MSGTDVTDETIFRDLSAEDDEQRPVEVESLCMNCGENGTTRIMCTRIPFYRQVIVMSFACEHCGYSNNEIQSGEAVQEHGTEIVLRVVDEKDLNRQLIKSEFVRIEIPELELVIEPLTQPGEITTVEGVLSRVRAGLEQDQERRRQEEPEVAEKIDQFIKRIERLSTLKENFTLKLRDASGNCFIQNPNPFHVDPHCITTHYHRSLVEKKMLALADDEDVMSFILCHTTVQETEPAPEWQSFEDAKHEVLRFPTDCPNCGAHIETCMKPTDVPYFSTVIIMSTTCDACGLRTNEVKSGGAIKDQGCKLIVSIEEVTDLARDVLKSDTCNMAIPELELEVGPGALPSRFTTVEGLLQATKDQLKEQGSFMLGDSADSQDKSRMSKFLEKFDAVLALKKKVHLILDDPAGNSYIQSLTAPLDDSRLEKIFYVRNFEQNEELGLNDMKTENYGELETVTEEKEGDSSESAKTGDNR
ncbi:Zinc finger protein ZPR1 -like protein [Toxocara canis]|uniref:Zinc finger protein ZPR1-like protein n=1 Tax=Toxocara canis TaxID=6265 RepID=A0A0B2VIW4_TOXCA|nr:Zinc finger protein ZPR1 -like protein [Toxocara canis]